MTLSRANILLDKLLKVKPYRTAMLKRYTAEDIPIKTEKLPDYMIQDIKENNKPDRRCINHFEKEIVTTKAGYFAGKPVVVSTYDDAADINALVDDFNISFNYEDTFSEITIDAAATGVGGMLLYKEDAEPRATRISPAEFYVDYRLNRPVDAIRYFLDDTGVEHLEYFDDKFITAYTRDNDGWVIDGEPVIHGYGRVPVVEVKNNRESQCDYHTVVDLIDSYNRLVSDLSNEIENFRLAYLLLVNLDLKEEDIRRLRQTGAIQLDKDSDVRFVTKNIDVKAIEVMKDILEKNISRFSGHVVFASDDFTGTLTRIAVHSKLQPLEQKSHTFELKFRNFLREFYAVYFSYAGLDAVYRAGDLVFQFTRNMPVNISEEIDAFVKLDGQVSDKTRMGMTSFINNPDDELNRIEQEKTTITKEIEK